LVFGFGLEACRGFEVLVVASWALFVEGFFFLSNCIGKFPISLTDNSCYGFMSQDGDIIYFEWLRKLKYFGGFCLDGYGGLDFGCWSWCWIWVSWLSSEGA
jgi:hypothetical protein